MWKTEKELRKEAEEISEIVNRGEATVVSAERLLAIRRDLAIIDKVKACPCGGKYAHGQRVAGRGEGRHERDSS